MKILIASDTYIFQTSGAANMVKELAAGLRRSGHDVRVMAPADSNRSFQRNGDVFLRSHKAFYYPDLRVSHAYRDPLIQKLIDWKPDLIHIHTEGSMYRMARRIAAKTGAPMIMTAHTNYEQWLFGPVKDTPPIRMIMRIYGRTTYHNVKAVISPSEKGRKLSQLRPVLDRLHVIPNGIRVDKIRQNTDPGERKRLLKYWDLDDNGCILITLTRISREKNIDELIRYFPALLKRVPDAQLLIVGDGPQRRRLESLSEKMGLIDRIRFTGRVEPEEVGHYYDLGDVFLSSSTFEMHSISCLEAMACGLPLVCRRDPWLKGVLEEGVNGFSYTTEQEFADRVTNILSDPSLHKRLGEGSLIQVKRFTMENYLEKTIDLYRSVAQSF